MRLAKPHLDIGLFTTDVPAHCAFWGEEVGLRLDHRLEVSPDWVQYRYDANGSVIKVNHRAGGLTTQPPSGLTGLTIARSGLTNSWAGKHPDGDPVELVAPDTDGIVGIGITLSSRDPERLAHFYAMALDFERLERDVLRCGDTIVRIVDGPSGSDVDDFAATGFRYLTVQVFDADEVVAAAVRGGGRVVRDVANLAGVARYGFVSDPDGNWIEISARTSLTGTEVT
ncbi:VOC family protein [Pseudonocardia xishanensis]|uniref:VOC domain-containing protein n=1 Tax=Pseudonocardia xishanensis TaxID=630995 RepID=A0ABP8RVU3_9PSEU